MKICVFGATGQTGQHIVEQALQKDYSVTAVARSAEKLASFGDAITILEGDLENKSVIKQAVQNQDAVISALGTTDRKPNTILSDGTAAIVEAMQATDCKRLVAITSLGCRDSLSIAKPLLFKLLVVQWIGREIWADKNRQEEVIEGSGLDYTIIRPAGISNKPAQNQYKVFSQHETLPRAGMLSRADLAHYVLGTVNDLDTVNKIVSVIQPK